MQTATDLKEILEDVEDRFETSRMPDFVRLAEEAAQHLDLAKRTYDRMDSLATAVISNEGQGDVR
jgi:hypothetical protein